MSREGWLLAAAGTPYEVGYRLGRALGARLEKNIDLYTAARTAGQVVDSADLRANALPWLRRLPDRFRGRGPSLRGIEWIHFPLEPSDDA